MKKIRFIGDVHGLYKPYSKICKRAEGDGCYTVQIGDMGFSYGHFAHFNLQGSNNWWFAGNHDNYDEDFGPENLGDFGVVELPDAVPFFFVRGAHSIDWMFRSEGLNWWRDEELSLAKCEHTLDYYSDYVNDDHYDRKIVVSHDCPDVMRDWLIENGHSITNEKIKTRTGQLLQAMYEMHQPSLWIFGHWHINIEVKIGRTTFRCIKELGTYDV